VAAGMWEMAGHMGRYGFLYRPGKSSPYKKYGVDWVNIGWRSGATCFCRTTS
jgi:hypothetical protein